MMPNLGIGLLMTVFLIGLVADWVDERRSKWR
jgi:hypothetical protein